MYTRIAIILSFAAATLAQNTYGKIATNPGVSCDDIYHKNPTSRGHAGEFWIKPTTGLHKVTCNMKLKCGGVGGGWMRVAHVDMTLDETCPGEWRTITSPARLCVGGVGAGCVSAQFSTNGISFEHICGYAKAYQKGHPDAFTPGGSGIDELYVDGLSITVGSPRQHVWTYATASNDITGCPCTGNSVHNPPSFVKDHYFCESGCASSPNVNIYYLTDPLWDGHGCLPNTGCCADLGMPWFYRKTTIPLKENVEVRICKNQPYSDEDTAVKNLEIYVI